jgi:hypothetical protein
MHYWIRTGNSLSPQPQRFLVQPRSASGAFPCDAFVQRGPPILVFVYDAVEKGLVIFGEQ